MSLRAHALGLWRLAALALAVAGVVFGTGCSVEPPEAELRIHVEKALANGFPTGVLEIIQLRRMGSSPWRAGDGRPIKVVYFDARLRFASAYDESDWEAAGRLSLAHALGASERGIKGLGPGAGRPGDQISVHGAMAYQRAGATWAPSDVSLGARASAGADGRVAGTLTAIQTIAASGAPGPEHAKRNRVVAEELSEALRNISRRLARQQDVPVIATGPLGGEYHTLLVGVAPLMTELGTAIETYSTAGSVENCRLLAAGRVDFAVVQSNIASQARAGSGPFAGEPGMTELRGVANLFPEAVHVLAPLNGDARGIPDLAGRRVAVGTIGSGTKFDAEAILEAFGLDHNVIRHHIGLEEAIAGIRASTLDAAFVTIAAPAQLIQGSFDRKQLRLLSISKPVQDTLAASGLGYFPYAIPAYSYPSQPAANPTLGVTAMLLTRASVEDAVVASVLTTLLEAARKASDWSARAALVTPDNARRAASIELHRAAERLLSTKS